MRACHTREMGGLNVKHTVRAWGLNLNHPANGLPQPTRSGALSLSLDPLSPPLQAGLLYPEPPLTSKSTLSPSGILGGTKLGMKSLLQRGIESQGSAKQLGP